MKKALPPKPILSPMMVQMIATYNEDGSVDLMNAAWGGQMDTDLLMLSLDKSHRTVANILREHCFTIGLPSQDNIVDCDFVGVVSGNVDPTKFEKTDLHASPSSLLHAPIIEEFPITFECETHKIIDDPDMGFYVIAKVRNIVVDEQFMGPHGTFKVDAMKLCFFSPLDNTYRAYGPEIAKAFSCGLTKKKGA